MKIILLTFFNCVVFALYCYLVSYIILQKEQKNIKKIITAFIPFLIMYYCILCLLDSIYAIFFSGICSYLFIKIIFEENNFMSLFISLVIHTLKIIIKILLLSIIDKDEILLINTYITLDWTAFYINLFTLVLAVIFIFLLRTKIRKFVKYISSLKNRQLILLIAAYINFIVIIVYQPPENVFSFQNITDFLIIFAITAIAALNISSEKKMELLTNYYNEIFEYSRANEELLTHYKMQVHENKNKLLMIKGMLDGPKKNLKRYVDEIIEELNDQNNNYWLTELKYIPLAGVRNFINYKLIKLKELGADIEVFVSSELEKIDASSLSDKEYNQMTTILGVVMDNMIESVIETQEKLVSINIYFDGDKIHAEFVNNFLGKIDLSRLNEIGYSTKGDQHGVGLPLVAKIIKMNDRFECKPQIIDNFFIQHMTIAIFKKNNLQKM